MRRLTTKQQFVLMLSTFVFVFLIIIYLIFYLIFRTATTYELSKELSREVKEVTSDHIALDKNQLIFTKDQEGKSLRQQLINDGYSALFLTNNLDLIKAFGLFELYGKEDIDNISKILSLSKNSVDKIMVQQASVNWRGQQLLTYIIPIKRDKQIISVLILGRSLEDINNVNRLILVVFVGLSLVSLVGSIALGYILASKAFKPIKKLTNIINDIDLDKLNQQVKYDGNKLDELAILTKRFNEMLDRLNRMSQQQKDFISNASHELKTPLTRAVTSLELMIMDQNYDKERLILVKKDMFEINNLLDKLLFLSRLNKATIKPGNGVNFFKVMIGIEKKYQDKLNQKDISFIKNYDREIELPLPKEYVEVLFSNIISNAIKYTPDHKELRVVGLKQDGTIIISVEDQGIGIDKAEIHRVFDRFYRGSDGRKVSSGDGIGLSIVKQICDLYDIKINMESQKGSGTKVSLKFPL